MKKQKLEEFSIIKDHKEEIFRDEYIFVAGGFGIVYNMVNLIKNLISGQVVAFMGRFYFKLNQPYRIKEARIVFVLQGEAVLLYNLMEYTITSSSILVIPTDSIIQVKRVKPGTQFRMAGFGPNFIPFARKEDQLEYYLGNRKNLVLPLTPEELEETERYFSLLWTTVQHKEFRREVVQNLLLALLHHINYIRKDYYAFMSNELTHQEEIFNRFISLVNKCAIKERNVGFYADKLCLTPRYLNTVVKQVGQQPVMEWINQAVVLEAKVLLKHSDLLIYQIADKLNFPNPSFFCKYFKRETGMTPQEYQRE